MNTEIWYLYLLIQTRTIAGIEFRDTFFQPLHARTFLFQAGFSQAVVNNPASPGIEVEGVA